MEYKQPETAEMERPDVRDACASETHRAGFVRLRKHNMHKGQNEKHGDENL